MKKTFSSLFRCLLFLVYRSRFSNQSICMNELNENRKENERSHLVIVNAQRYYSVLLLWWHHESSWMNEQKMLVGLTDRFVMTCYEGTNVRMDDLQRLCVVRCTSFRPNGTKKMRRWKRENEGHYKYSFVDQSHLLLLLLLLLYTPSIDSRMKLQRERQRQSLLFFVLWLFTTTTTLKCAAGFPFSSVSATATA